MKPIDIPRLRIIDYPDPCLRKVCRDIDVFDDELAALAEKMLHLMHASKGIGLAGPQVGVLRRIFVCNVTGEPKDNLVLINPRLGNFMGTSPGEEGCLSLPDVTVTVNRAVSCEVDALDVRGKPIKAMASDLAARCWQHENDHLNGKLIIDYMSAGDQIANRRALKRMEADFKKPVATY